MSQELESTIEALIRTEEKKKLVGKEQYKVNKEFKNLYSQAVAFVKSNHSLPSDSEYFVEMVEEEIGRVSWKAVVNNFIESHQKYASTIQRLAEESKKTLSEKLLYGIKS